MVLLHGEDNFSYIEKMLYVIGTLNIAPVIVGFVILFRLLVACPVYIVYFNEIQRTRSDPIS